MNLLPSSDWANVATQTQLEAGLAGVRAELEGLRHTTDLRFDAVDQRFDATKAEMYEAFSQQTRTIVFAMIGAMTAYTALILAALHGHG